MNAPNPSTIQIIEQESALVVEISGYFDGKAGAELTGQLAPFLKAGRKFVVIDLVTCDLLNSPGVTALLELSIKITEDFLGKLIICGSNPLMNEVFTMAGVFPIADRVPDRASALKLRP